MPASIVIVHDDPAFTDDIASHLAAHGREFVVYATPMLALEALERARRIQVLVTRVDFQPGQPNGISLALVTRNSRPGIKVLFTGHQEHARFTAGIGKLVEHPVQTPELIAEIEQLLT